jgi:hypothetical protein
MSQVFLLIPWHSILFHKLTDIGYLCKSRGIDVIELLDGVLLCCDVHCVATLVYRIKIQRRGSKVPVCMCKFEISTDGFSERFAGPGSSKSIRVPTCRNGLEGSGAGEAKKSLIVSR